MRPARVLIVVLEIVLIVVVSSAVIHYVVSSPPSRRDAAAMKFRAVNNAKFTALFKSGTKEIQDAQYPAALATFQEAEQTTGELTDDQYASLKDSRQQIARLYESSGRDSEAEATYKALANSGIR
jgi:hypothetical protein